MLNKLSNRPEAEKEEINKGLLLESMSPEQSEEERDNNDDDDKATSESEESGQRPVRKVLVVRPLVWRSEKFTNILQSLDRKYMRKQSGKARLMMIIRKPGRNVDTPGPENLPNWMVNS